VLHPEPAFFHPRRGVYLSSEAHGHTLFERAQLLVSVLAPYPDVKIVLSTSWAQHRSYSKAAKRLPAELQARLIGATFRDGHMSRDNWLALSRGAQVLGDVGRRRPAHWVALDDDDDDWPEKHLDNLVETDPMLGLARHGAVEELQQHFESWGETTRCPKY
jgi:HAD domain in Swiss Army Knife RNA repair proteins